jgi:hypothetical protein
MKCSHQLDDCDLWAGVSELMIGIGGGGPAPRVGEGVKLGLADLSVRFAKEDVVISVRIERRIELEVVAAFAVLLISAGTWGRYGRGFLLSGHGNQLVYVVRRRVVARQCHSYNQLAD